MSPQPSGIEVVWLTPHDLLVAFVVLLMLVVLAFVAGCLARVWDWFGRDEPEPPATPDDAGSVTTVELPAETRHPRRPRPHRTGTIHAAPVASDDSPTEVICRPDGVAS